MAIYNIFDYQERLVSEECVPASVSPPKIDLEAMQLHHTTQLLENTSSWKERFFSALAARFFFMLLLIADLLWGAYSIVLFAITSILYCGSIWQIKFLRQSLQKTWLNIKRSIVCGISLSVAIFSPALGIMFSCMYFLMYDRSGVEEIVPVSLQDQFREFFPS